MVSLSNLSAVLKRYMQAKYILRSLATLLASSVVFLAATFPSTGYTVQAWPGCSGSYNSGSWDLSGNLYVPCGSPSTVRVYDFDGNLFTTFSAGYTVRDAVPSPDGQFVYTTGDGSPRKFDRQPDGSFSRDTTWSLDKYPMYGSQWTPTGLFLAVDHSGYIYLADGAWAGNGTHTVIKYAPDGTFVTRFGEYGQTWQLGKFYWMLTGVAVTPDGSRVYTVEVGNNRIQVWDQQANGTYAATDSWGGTENNNPDRGGYCTFGGWQGAFAAPYDVALDSLGNVYVINTTCKQIIKFDDTGNYLTDVDVRLNGGDYPRPHGFAVAADGTVYVGENQKVAIPDTRGPVPSPNPTPEPDTTDPLLLTVTLPEFTTEQTIEVTVGATDNVGVVQMRLANEDGNWLAWAPFEPTTNHTLSAGYGRKGVFVQVRDEALNESGVSYKKLNYVKPLDIEAPVINSVSIPTPTSTQTLDVTVQAMDNVGVTEMRLANEDGNWMIWVPFKSVTQHSLTGGFGKKGVFVQVRDDTRNESEVVFTKVLYRP